MTPNLLGVLLFGLVIAIMVALSKAVDTLVEIRTQLSRLRNIEDQVKAIDGHLAYLSESIGRLKELEEYSSPIGHSIHRLG